MLRGDSVQFQGKILTAWKLFKKTTHNRLIKGNKKFEFADVLEYGFPILVKSTCHQKRPLLVVGAWVNLMFILWQECLMS